MGIRNDWPELASIVDKGLSTITSEEQNKIRNRYITLRYDQSNTAEVIKWVLIVAGIGSSLLLLFVFWNISLSRKVKERTISLAAEITERKQAEEKVRESEIGLKKAQQISHVGSWKWNIQTNHLEWSDEMYVIFNINKETFSGNLNEAIIQRIHPDDKAQVEHSNRSVIENHSPIPIEYRVVWEDGTVRTVWAESGEPTFNESGHPMILTGIVQDITDRKKAEDQVKASLKEKETLLHEIHHRVKNNMQVIASLLRLQVNKQDDPIIKSILNENVSRVYAMSAIHESLYQSETLSEINFKSYLSQLSQMLLQTFVEDQSKVTFRIDSPELKLNIEKANPLGLVLNELISNSLKYAFPLDKKGEINIVLKKREEQEVELSVSDNGVGMPNDFDWKHTDTLGLKLVKELVESQLNGSIEMSNQNGTKFTIKFNIGTSLRKKKKYS